MYFLFLVFYPFLLGNLISVYRLSDAITLLYHDNHHRAEIQSASTSPACHGCARPFSITPSTTTVGEGISPYGRYKCPECLNDFCTDCDVFVHDVVHSCPGCGR